MKSQHVQGCYHCAMESKLLSKGQGFGQSSPLWNLDTKFTHFSVFSMCTFPGLAFLGTQRATRHSFCLGGDPTKRWCPKASACSQPAGLCCWGSWEAVLSSALPSWAAVVCLLCLPLPWAESFPEAGTSSSCAPVRAWLSSGPVCGALTDEGVRQSHGQSAMGAPRRAGKLGSLRGDDIAAGPEMIRTTVPGREEGEGCSGRGLDMGTICTLVGLEEE